MFSGTGTISPAMSVSPPINSNQSSSDVTSQAKIQKNNAMMCVEAAFKMMEGESLANIVHNGFSSI